MPRRSCRLGWRAARSAALGPGAAAALIDDPWRILDGGEADLRQADRLASVMGRSRDEPSRGPAVLVHLLLLAARAGDTAAPADSLMASALSRGVPDPVKALETAVEAGRIEVDASKHDPRDAETGAWVMPIGWCRCPRYAIAEDALAEGLARLAGRPADRRAGRASGWRVSMTRSRPPSSRRSAHGVSLLTGGPGTGKSRTVSAVVELATGPRSPSRPRGAYRAGRQAARGAHRGKREHRPPAARRRSRCATTVPVELGLHPG